MGSWSYLFQGERRTDGIQGSGLLLPTALPGIHSLLQLQLSVTVVLSKSTYQTTGFNSQAVLNGLFWFVLFS